MSNLTLAIDDEVLRRARIRALEDGTSVNAVVREYLLAYAGGDRAKQALTQFLQYAEVSHASSGPRGRSWTRDDLYEGS